MKKKRLFEPGDMVSTFTGQVGMVISTEALAMVRTRFKEGRRPGYYFAQGCCQNPDYLTQIPVFFEDGTFDVMRSMNIKKRADLPEETKSTIQEMMGTEP
ncbi:MAG: hypothetical protein AMK69_06045 [Nitrospira bacterium SG8_3]|nr:MAG: hypothetical protein AMK69_06045 [Nitrospira bacterium SG8_3]